MKTSDALAFVALLAAIFLIFPPTSATAVEVAAEAAVDDAEADKGEKQPVEEEEAAETGFDRSRGTLKVSKKDGQYEDGSHFAKWFWNLDVPRPGMYNVNLVYTSVSPKIGVQAKIGQFPALKSYIPRSGGVDKEQSIELGRVYIDKADKYPIFLLTGDKSDGPSVFVRRVELVPAPESSPTHSSDKSAIITRPHSGEVGQSIDGEIVLPAGGATTWSEKMRYEPKDEKNCLGFWTEIDDWAEWSFSVHTPGRYKVEVVQGCGEGQGGSKVGVQVGSEDFEFEVVDTGGFQNWQSIEVGELDLDSGVHKLSLKPLSKAAKAALDVHKIVLKPVTE